MNSAQWWREYSKFLASPQWQALRHACLRRDGYQCTRCHAPTQLQAHHIRYSRNPWNTRLSDLATLCLTCHERCHGRPLGGVIPAGRGGPGHYPRPRYEPVQEHGCVTLAWVAFWIALILTALAFLGGGR